MSGMITNVGLLTAIHMTGMSLARMFLGTTVLIILVIVIAFGPKILKALKQSKKAKEAAKKPKLPVNEAAPELPEEAPADLRPGLMKKSFKSALKVLKRRSAARDWLYDIPWHLLVGHSASGKTAIIESLGGDTVGPPALRETGRKAGVAWGLLDGGVFLDVNGWYMREPVDPASKKSGWNSAMRMLRKYRRARPVDGVVLTIPADVLAAKGAEAEDRRDRMGKQILERLQVLQRILGVRCPVYVVVSQCSHLKGFGAFARAVPDTFTDDILGWSSPYSMDATFRDAWLGEAFRSINGALSEVQLALFADRSDLSDKDDLYLFRQSVAQLEAALTPMVTALFKQTVYLEPFILRGVYLVGESDAFESPQETSEDGFAMAPRPQVGFLRQLVDGKILPETGLVKLGSKALTTRLRKVRSVQLILAAIGIVLLTGLGFAAQRLSRATDTLHPVLTSMRGEKGASASSGMLAQAEAVETATDAAAGPRYSRSLTLRLLSDMGELSYGQLRSVFLPSSYMSDIDSRIQQAVTMGYERVIFPALVSEMELRADKLLGEVSKAALRAIPGAVLEQTPALTELKRRIEGLRAIEDVAGRYAAFVASEEKDLKELSALCEELFGESLPEGFFRNFEFHEAALARATGPALDPTQFQLAAGEMARKLTTALYASVFDASELSASLRKLEDELGRFKRLRIGTRPKHETMQVMRGLASAINDAEAQARRARFPMLNGSRFAPGEMFGGVLDGIDASGFFPDMLREELITQGENAFSKAQDSLYKTSSEDFKSLLEQRVWSTGFRLTSQLLLLRDAMEGLLTADFCKVYDPLPLTDVPADTTIRWKIEVLQRAKRIVENYDAARRAGWDDLTGDFPSKLSKIARVHARAATLAAVGEARGVLEIVADDDSGGQPDWQEAEMANFKLAEPLLSPLIEDIKTVEFLELAGDVEKTLYRQAGELLSFADVALANARPYETAQPTFSWWTGEVPPALEAFGLTDPLDLRPFVLRQRQVITRIARDRAGPAHAILEGKKLADILESADDASRYEELVERWGRILTALKMNDAKQPGNSVDALESMILGDMAKVTLATCFEEGMLREHKAEYKDYFLERRARARMAVKRRCNELAAEQAMEEYEILRQEMEPLVNKFPFLLCPFDANPAKVRRALDKVADFDKKHRVTIETNPAFVTSRGDVLGFLDKMAAVNAFFETTLRLEGNIPSLAFDVAAAFRVNRTLEVGANQVINWYLRLNRNDMDLRTPEEERVRWGLGDRVEVGFRWARNGFDSPTAKDQPVSARVEGDRISYTYAGPWSILRLVRTHSATPEMLAENVDVNPHTLAFRIQTKRDKVPREDTTYDQRRNARLFTRVSLYSPTTKARLTVPEFPTEVPRLRRLDY